MQNDARLSNKELAAQVGLAPSSCLERVRRLTRLGVLKAWHAEIEPRFLGITLQALVFVRLKQHSRKTVREFRQHALALPESMAVYHVAGQHDFLVHVGVRDADHLRDLALDAFTTRPEVAQIETHLIFEHTRRALQPVAAPGDEPGPSPRRRRAARD